MAGLIILDLMGGVALLLWGLHMVQSGVLRAFGADLRHFLGKALRNRFRAFGFGVVVTAILQSSTATALMASSFAASGLLALTPALAIMLHAVVGGTPAYRSLVRGDSPDSVADFDDWVLRTLLDPATPLFREARYLLEEESGIRDSALYYSTLAAVADGQQTRGAIANYIGRKAADIGHHLNVLEDCGLLRRDPDLFRSGRSFTASRNR